MIEVKYNRLFTRSFPLFVTSLCWFVFVCSLVITIVNEQYNILEAQLYLTFTFMCSLITHLCSKILHNIGENFKIIFNDSGITQKFKINIGFIIFTNKEYMFPWEKILKVNYTGGFFSFCKYKNFVSFLPFHQIGGLMFLMVNIKEAFEFALTKLPLTCEINKNARVVLKKRYGITLEKEMFNG